MILDRQSKSALDRLLDAKPDRPRKSYSYDYVCEVLGLSADDIFPILKKLVSDGLAEYAYTVTKSGKKDVGIALTQNGLKYKEIGRLERRERWKERMFGFAFGVFTSVISSIIIKLAVG